MNSSISHDEPNVATVSTPIVSSISEQSPNTMGADAVAFAGNAPVMSDNIDPVFSTPQLPEFSVSDVLHRWTLLGTMPLANSDIPMTQTAFSLSSFYITSPQLMDKMKNFKYWNGDIELMGVVSIPGNCSGAYAVTLVPSYGFTDGALEASQCLAFEHSHLVMASNSETFTLRAPYFSVFDATHVINPDGGIWTLYVTTLSPIHSAIPGGVASGQIRFYARFAPGTALSVPVFQGKKVHEENPSDKGKWSDTLKGVSNMASKVVGIPLLGGVAAQVQSAASMAAGVADMFGFSRTAETADVISIVPRPFSSVTTTDGQDNPLVAGFSVANKISIDPPILGGGEQDTLSFEHMSSRPVLIGAFPWTATDDTGVSLASYPITPGYGYQTAADWHVFTGAGYCGLPFKYWRANAEYYVVIPSSALHRGALQVFYSGDVAPGVAVDITNISMNGILDISESSVFKVSMGYCENAPMLELLYSSGTGSVPAKSSLGNLNFRVVNPLLSQNPADEVTVLVFATFKDVQFAVPRDRAFLPNGVNPSRYWKDDVVFQGFPLDTQDITVIPDVPPYPVAEFVAGESISSLRAIAQMPSRIRLKYDHVNTITRNGAVASTASIVTGSYLAVAPFTSSASSQRLYVYTSKETWVAVKRGEDTYSIEPSASGCTWARSTAGGVAFMIPFYSGERKGDWVARQQSSNGAQGRINLWIPEDAVYMEAFHALGDDLRVGLFRGIPNMKREELAKIGWMSISTDPV